MSEPTRWVWWHRPTNDDPHRSGLLFTDILFGLVLAEVLRRGNELSDITGAGLAHLGLAAVVVITSWIGYHNSQKRSDYRMQFLNLPLLKFTLDMSMVFFYWLLAVNPEGLPELAGRPSFAPSADLDVTLIFVIFILYVAWDLASWGMTKEAERYPKATHDWNRTWVSIVAAIAVGVLALGECIASPDTTKAVVLLDVVLILILIAYRFAKDALQRPNGAHPGTSASNAGIIS